MFITSRVFGSVLLGLVLLSGSAWAAPSSLEGTVRDAQGQVIKGADIRIEAKDGSRFSKTVRSDAKGHYVYGGLTGGSTYQVTLLINGAMKACINNVKAELGTASKLNFDLKQETAKKKATHMVYLPAQTGSNLGGRWVEVDEQGNANADAVGANNVQRTGAGALGKMQSNSGSTGNGN
jgi:hypothetical protein